MKILLCGNRYFLSGGPERYLFAVQSLLEQRGHEVIPFAMQYQRNLPSPFASWFAPHPVDDRYVYFGDVPLSKHQKLKLLAASLYNPQVYRAAKDALRHFQIEIVYALQVTNYLSPALFSAARDLNIPVVYRQSDFHLLCPAYHFFRDGKPCQECLRGLRHAVIHKCLKHSTLVSAARVAGMVLERLLRVDSAISRYITPSSFLRETLVGAGFDASRVIHIPTATTLPAEVKDAEGGFLLYTGNLAPHKGVDVLLQAMKSLPEIPLRIAGHLGVEEQARYRGLCEKLQLENVEFLGFCNQSTLNELYSDCRALVFPSLWYENMPNSILEAMSFGRPIIGSNLGSLPELIQDGVNGFAVPPGDPGAIAQAARRLFADRDLSISMGRASRRLVEENHTWPRHLDRLEEVFSAVIRQ